MDPAVDPVQRIRQGAEASVRFMAEHQTYFALLDVERTDDTLAGVMKEGSDVYVSDVQRLVEGHRRSAWWPTATLRSARGWGRRRRHPSATPTGVDG